jgi:hypothetical protein
MGHISMNFVQAGRKADEPSRIFSPNFGKSEHANNIVSPKTSCLRREQSRNHNGVLKVVFENPYPSFFFLSIFLIAP